MNHTVEYVSTDAPSKTELPVLVKIWIRPELQKQQYEMIRRARPSIMILDSDGGRNEAERRLIDRSRAVFNDVDWTCEVHRLFHSKNHGLYESNRISSEYVWERFDRAIFLEDDIQFSDSFFPWCAEMLERYETDTRVFAVCGMNHEGISEGVPYDYFFSREASIWGVAYWRRTFEDRGVPFETSKYTREAIIRAAAADGVFRKKIRGYTDNPWYGGHLPGGEFWNQFAVFGQNQLYIVPKMNMIRNVGCNSDSTHSDEINLLPRGIRRVFNMPLYECEFPLKHPICMVPDVRYQESVYDIMAHGRPVRSRLRRIERGVRSFVYKGPSATLQKYLSSRHRIET